MIDRTAYDREPDIETPFFKLWLDDEGQEGFIHLGDNERINETRVYGHLRHPLISALIISKLCADGKIEIGVRYKKKRRVTCEFKIEGELTKEEYSDFVGDMESDLFEKHFDISNPVITEGKLYSVYDI